MKLNLSHFQKLNQENIQERINRRRLSITGHQTMPPPPPPPEEPQQAEANLDLRLSLGYNQPTPPQPPQEPQQAEATLDLRLSLGYDQPMQPPPQPQQAEETASSSPPSETNHQDHHEATLDLYTFLSPNPQAMALADPSSYLTSTIQTVLQSHVISRNHPRSQEIYYQERAIPLPPRTTTTMESFCSLSSKQIDHHKGQNEDPRPRLDTLRPGKTETIPAPYPWATTRRATVHSLNHLLSQGINIIIGEVQCHNCWEQYEITYDLQQNFTEVALYISRFKSTMHGRAPAKWMKPGLLNCESCKQSNRVWPVISKIKRSINWLFLLLGQMLGCCKLRHLKYFCKHTRNIRPRSKDQLLYLTYLGLCKQLDPDGPFDP